MASGVAFEVDEGRTVSNDVLHVLHVGDIKSGIKDFAHDPLRDGEPYLTIRRG